MIQVGPKCALCALVLCLVLTFAGCTTKGSPVTKREGGVPVTVATVIQKDVPLQIEVIGNVEAYSTITVKAQVGGAADEGLISTKAITSRRAICCSPSIRGLSTPCSIRRRPISPRMRRSPGAGTGESGSRHRPGEVRAIASRPLRAAVPVRALSRRISPNRCAPAPMHFAAVVSADKAAIESARATVVATKATVETCRVQLDYTTIRSPIDGRTGNIMVKQGNVVTANTIDLMTINQVEPIYVTFSVPEAQLTRHQALHGRWQAAGHRHPAGRHGCRGERASSPSSTTPWMRPPAPSSSRAPSRMPTASSGRASSCGSRCGSPRSPMPWWFPIRRCRPDRTAQFVFVVKPDRTVESRPVTPGRASIRSWWLKAAWKPGETVVTEGQLRLAPGSRVQVRDGRRQTSGAAKEDRG